MTDRSTRPRQTGQPSSRRQTDWPTHRRQTGQPTRRRLLRWVGAGPAAVLAGCTGGDGETPESVPETYRTATAQSGDTRDPDQVAAKEVVDYQAEPNGDQRCAECRFFVPDRDGDGLGACAIVEGTIDPDGWCSSYAPPV